MARTREITESLDTDSVHSIQGVSMGELETSNQFNALCEAAVEQIATAQKSIVWVLTKSVKQKNTVNEKNKGYDYYTNIFVHSFIVRCYAILSL